MDRKKSQSYNFCFEALPSLFHAQTKDFFKYLEKDGIKFIEFWWDHVGARLPYEMLVPFTNASVESFMAGPKTKVVMLALPHPRNEGELYFAGMISNPERKFAWVKLPRTRIIGLARASKDKFVSGTELGDVTPRGMFVSLGEGPEPTKEAFRQSLLSYANKEAERA